MKNPAYVHVEKWGWWLLLGILLIVIGLILLSAPMFASVATVFMIGLLLVAAGIVHVVASLIERHTNHFWSYLVVAIITFIVGLLMLVNPGVTLATLTLLIAVFFLTNGIFRIVNALYSRFRGWGWVLLNGLVSLVLAILILIQWPVSSLWVIGLFAGIDFLFAGISLLLISLFFKKGAFVS